MAKMNNIDPDERFDPRLIEELNLLRSLPARSPQAARQAYERFVTELDSLSLPAPSKSLGSGFPERLSNSQNNQHNREVLKMFTSRNRFILTAIAVILVGFVLLFGGSAMTALASQSSLPGDSLYPFKRTLENTRFSLARDAVARSELQLEYAERRLAEIDGLIAEGRYHNITIATQEFESYIKNALIEVNRISATDPAQAAELLLRISDSLSRYANSLNTMLNNVPEPARSEIQRTITALQDVRDAENLSVGVEFIGMVESMTTEIWQVNGRQIQITSRTEIKGPVQVGETVKVHAVEDPDGALIAREIELVGGVGSNVNTNENANTNVNENTNMNTNENTNMNTNENTNTNTNENTNTNTNVNNSTNLNENLNDNSNWNDNSNDNRNSNE